MEYVAAIPTAVFLGPSLPQETAREILPANYYPPVRMGDVYRLLGTGVRTIVVIDGLFHAVTPVWQRELLEAVERGIRVIGASSMGALRAAELHVYGMEGCGQVFEWYRDGLIEGDDEVALMHAAEAPFTPLSEPLVNIRYALTDAEARGLLDAAQAGELLSLARSTFYGHRSLRLLARHARERGWTAAADFLAGSPPNLKAADARLALQRALAPPPPPSARPAPVRSPLQAQQHRGQALLRRGLLRGDGRLFPATAALRLLAQEPERGLALLLGCGKAFLLSRWAQARGFQCPEEFSEAYLQLWQLRFAGPDLPAWLRANGLTEDEFTAGVARHALLEWLLADVTRAGLPPRDDYSLVRRLLGNDGEQTVGPEAAVPGLALATELNPGLRLRLAECRLLCAWAEDEGVECPPEVLTQARAALCAARGCEDLADVATAAEIDPALLDLIVSERARADWIAAMGPPFFGYLSWEPDPVLVERLQLSGEAARRLARTEKRP